jgi:hypothetical protein
MVGPQKPFRKTAGAAAEFKDLGSLAEIPMGDEVVSCLIFIEALRILLLSEAVNKPLERDVFLIQIIIQIKGHHIACKF